MVIFRRLYIASWCLVKDVSFIHLFVKYACLSTASVEESSSFQIVLICSMPATKPKNRTIVLSSYKNRSYFARFKVHCFSSRQRKKQNFSKCVFSLPHLSTGGYGTSSRFGRILKYVIAPSPSASNQLLFLRCN